MIEVGMERATASVLRTLRRKKRRIRIARKPPMRALTFRSLMELWIYCAWL
jgi:hypothetical protein